MKVAALTALGNDSRFEIWDDVEIDKPQGREVKLDVKASGLCHSDLHASRADYGLGQPPIVMGHEVAGIVTEVGPEVTEFAIGDHVVASLIQSCGHCVTCLSGNGTACINGAELTREGRITRGGVPITQAYGISGFAEQSLVHENQLVKVDPALPYTVASLLGCGVITGAGAVINAARVRPGESVVVVGVGGVGLNAISGARIAGASSIIAVDLADEKLEFAKKFGATHGVNSSSGDPIAAVQEITGGGADHAFEVIGRPELEVMTVRMTKRGGNAHIIGLTKPADTIELAPMTDLLTTIRSLNGVFMGSTIIKRDIPMYGAFYLQGRMNLDDLVAQEIPLDQINDAYDQLDRGEVAGRSVITSF